jgi:3-oxoadipate enol-lactonase
MATIRVNGTSLYYEDSGGGGAPIVFSHGLLWNTALFAPQIAALKERYRCVAYDHRGQGRSADGTGHAIDLETLTADAAALIEALGLGRVHFCGLSMGGFVAMRLGIKRPDLVHSLVLMETSADPEPRENLPKYRLLNWMARLFGAASVANSVMPVMFGKTTLEDPARAAERLMWRGLLAANRRSIWRAVNGVLERSGVHDDLGKIATPTLVIVGDEDVATVPAKAKRIAQAIAGAQLVIIPRAGHSSTVEQPAAVTAAIAKFLDEVHR